MLTLLVYILFVVLIVGLLLWALNSLPLDATIKQWGRVAIIVVFALFLIGVLFGGINLPAPRWLR